MRPWYVDGLIAYATAAVALMLALLALARLA